MKRIVFLFLGYAIAGFSLMSAVYAFLKATKLTIYGEHGLVFGALFRMYLYHERHPYQYLLLVAIVYGCLATMWAHYAGKAQRGWKRAGSIIGVMVLTIICSSVPGGMLWVFHDTQAGFFPGMNRFLNNLWWGAGAGLSVGWLIFMLSIPYNVLCLLSGYYLTDYIEKTMRRRNWISR
ncbi:hypothetical protein [cf. Phormidesmis sp. LEGE 11477]|uniref:hypothetical protein n=1 Tax=cf. Phormidesmis sp. LEGE 11477 TaxID=1828680 RepID=UPI00188114B0|nr:hypothetical protein [cf. Phormidesmis sp. LEGE 11477]MBE9060065.1 hypothetical protein [cf. Phormidesmis sp. LEGE 11477]